MRTVLDYSEKVALVTGAAAGMGLAAANAFAEAGAAVVLADSKEEAVKEAAQSLVAAGHKAIAVRCDVSDDSQLAALVDRSVAEFGRIDAAFNNAGVMARVAPTADSTREDWDRVIGINLRGVWSCMKHELRHMELQGSGAIVNNASVGALTATPGCGLIYRFQARRSWPDTDGRARIHQERYPRERNRSWPHRYSDRSRCRQRKGAGL